MIKIICTDIDVDLRVRNLTGIHSYKKDSWSHISRNMPWGEDNKSATEFRRRVCDYIRRKRQAAYQWTRPYE